MTMTGLVFRRLGTDAEWERARLLLQASGLGLPAASRPGLEWFGLWDLGSPEGEDLAAVAVTCQADRDAVELCALAVPAARRGRGLGRRLLGEVVNRARTGGARYLVAWLSPTHREGRALLRAAGFSVTERHHEPEGPKVRLLLEL
jgi:GNAT superfamily N-acetyltransferase